MLKNYLTYAWRYIIHNSFYSLINLLGLVTGMITFMLLIQFVLHEYSYDNFLDKSDRLFRVQQDRYDKGELSTRWASGCAGIGPALKANFPEVESYVRLRKNGAVLSIGDRSYREEELFFAGNTFFKMFSIPLIRGVDSLALKEPSCMVISQSMARKYFNDEDALGKTLRVNGDREVKITGVFKDLPENTHMKFKGLVSFATFESYFKDLNDLNTWNWDGYMTYILLNKNTDPRALEAKLPAFVEREHGEELRHSNHNVIFHLQPVRSIHLDSNFMFELQRNGDRNTTRYLMVIAIIILIIAWINFINLSTARSIERAREVGIRKVMGGLRIELIRQFLLESVLINTSAAVISLILAIILTPWFGSLSGRELNFFLFRQPFFWIGFIAMILLGSVLSGIYPAFVLSSHKPIGILKGKLKNSSQGIALRKGLVILQFIASIALIIGTFVVYRQIRYLQNQSIGVNIDQTLVIKSPDIVDSTYRQKYNVFRQNLIQNAEVSNVSASTEVPGTQPLWNAGGIRRLSQREDEAAQYRVIMMDADFIPSYGLQIVAGRAFSSDNPNEEKNVLMNEAACKLIGFAKPEDAIDDRIYFWGDTFRIVGVVKNYGQESLKKAYDPTIYRFDLSPGGYYSVKFNTANVKESMVKFENNWKDIFPGNPFDYFFLDDHYNSQYKADQQFGVVFGIFSALAIFIACLGLFGLSSLSVMQRTKEIGIRKVLGAGGGNIISLIGREYLILMGIAIAFAIPMAGWIMGIWLEDFAVKISLSWWLFVIPCFIVILIAFVAISFNTMKAIRTDPVETLRYE